MPKNATAPEPGKAGDKSGKGDGEEAKKEFSQAGIDFLTKAVGRDKQKEKPPEKPKGDDKPPVTKPVIKAKPQQPQQQQPVVDVKELGTAIATAVVEANEKIQPKKGKADKADEQDLFSDPGEQRRLKVLERMETLSPDRNKGLVERYKTAYRTLSGKLATYADQWEKDNPGEKFDEKDDAHADFIQNLEDDLDKSAGYEPDDYTEALADLKADEKFSKAKDTKDPEIEELKREKKIREAAPEIIKSRDAASNHFWNSLGETFDGVVKEDGSIDLERLKAISESDADAHEEALKAVKAVDSLSTEIHMLSRELVPFDDKSEAHNYLAQFAVSAEERMLKRPADKQLDDEGRKFVTKSEYLKLPEAKRKTVWTYGPDDLSFLLAANIAKKALDTIKAEEEKFSRRAKARGINLEAPAPRRTEHDESSDNNDELEDEPGTDDDGKPKSPSSTAEPKSAAARDKGRLSPKTPQETFLGRAISKT